MGSPGWGGEPLGRSPGDRSAGACHCRARSARIRRPHRSWRVTSIWTGSGTIRNHHLAITWSMNREHYHFYLAWFMWAFPDDELYLCYIIIKAYTNLIINHVSHITTSNILIVITFALIIWYSIPIIIMWLWSGSWSLSSRSFDTTMYIMIILPSFAFF